MLVMKSDEGGHGASSRHAIPNGCGHGPPLPLLILSVESTQFPFALAITSSLIDTSDERCK
jgi:hypothetical protein